MVCENKATSAAPTIKLQATSAAPTIKLTDKEVSLEDTPWIPSSAAAKCPLEAKVGNGTSAGARSKLGGTLDAMEESPWVPASTVSAPGFGAAEVHASAARETFDAWQVGIRDELRRRHLAVEHFCMRAMREQRRQLEAQQVIGAGTQLLSPAEGWLRQRSGDTDEGLGPLSLNPRRVAEGGQRQEGFFDSGDMARQSTGDKKHQDAPRTVASKNFLKAKSCYLKRLDLKYESELGWFGQCWKLEAPEPRGWLADRVTSGFFERACFCVIILNTALSVYTTNESALDFDSDGRTFSVADLVFTGFYTLELFLKLLVHKQWLFWNSDWAWNWLDSFVVLASLIECSLAWTGLWAPNLVALRIYRVLRAAKVLRVFKAFHFLQDLRLMVSCLLNCVVPLTYATVLVVLVLMIGSLVFVDALTYSDSFDDMSPALEETIRIRFGSVQGAMITLLQCTTGGIDWNEVYSIVARAGRFYAFLFIIYILFFIFALFNVVTSIFVDRCARLAQPDFEAMVMKSKSEELRLARELASVLFTVTGDSSGLVTAFEMREILRNPRMRRHLESFGLVIKDVDAFFETVRHLAGGAEHLDVHTLAAGCLMMKGTASSFELHALAVIVQRIERMFLDLAPPGFEDVPLDFESSRNLEAVIDVVRTGEMEGMPSQSRPSESWPSLTSHSNE